MNIQTIIPIMKKVAIGAAIATVIFLGSTLAYNKCFYKTWSMNPLYGMKNTSKNTSGNNHQTGNNQSNTKTKIKSGDDINKAVENNLKKHKKVISDTTKLPGNPTNDSSNVHKNEASNPIKDSVNPAVTSDGKNQVPNKATSPQITGEAKSPEITDKAPSPRVPDTATSPGLSSKYGFGFGRS